MKDRKASCFSTLTRRAVPDAYRYYQYQDKTMCTPYLSAADGKDHTAASELIVYSGEYGCADTLLAAFF